MTAIGGNATCIARHITTEIAKPALGMHWCQFAVAMMSHATQKHAPTDENEPGKDAIPLHNSVAKC
jgi:hypothetical protein